MAVENADDAATEEPDVEPDDGVVAKSKRVTERGNVRVKGEIDLTDASHITDARGDGGLSPEARRVMKELNEQQLEIVYWVREFPEVPATTLASDYVGCSPSWIYKTFTDHLETEYKNRGDVAESTVFDEVFDNLECDFTPEKERDDGEEGDEVKERKDVSQDGEDVVDDDVEDVCGGDGDDVDVDVDGVDWDRLRMVVRDVVCSELDSGGDVGLSKEAVKVIVNEVDDDAVVDEVLELVL